MEKYDIIITILTGLWVFLLGWVLKIQKDLGKMRQNEINIMNEIILIRQDQKEYQRTDKCNILHTANHDSINQFKDMIVQRLNSIELGQKEMQNDIKSLLKQK
jgi:hypothetical protein